MAGIVWLDGFDHYTNATDGSEGSWTRTYGSGYPWDKGLVAGRYGGLGLKLVTTGGAEAVYRNLGATYTNYTHGFAVYIPAITAYSFVYYASASGGSYQLAININNSGGLEVFRGTWTLIGSTASVFTSIGWYYIEVSVVTHATTGSVTIDVNGVNKMALTNVNTNPAGTGGISYIHYVEANNQIFDDTYFADDLVRYGPCRVQSLVPASDVAGGVWVPNSGANGYSRVSEMVNDLDTTYISASSVNDVSRFGLAASTALGIKAIAIETVAKKTDGTTRAIKAQLKSGSTTVEGATQTLLTTYETKQDIFTVNPDTGTGWLQPDLNAIEIGSKVVT